MECEPPTREIVTIEPGAPRSFPRNGRIGRYERTSDRMDRCLRPFPPPAGGYIFKVEGQRPEYVGVARAILPMDSPLVIEVGARERAKISCAGFSDEERSRIVDMALARIEILGEGPEGFAVCEPEKAACVDTWDRGNHEATISSPCDIAVYPDNNGSEVKLAVDKEEYGLVFDTDGIHVTRVKIAY